MNSSVKTPSLRRRRSRRACFPDQRGGGQRGDAAGAPWRSRPSFHPTRLASQQCTQMPRNCAEGPFSPICVHSLSPRLSTTAHLTERRTLHSPLDRGETKKRILLQRLTKNRSLVSPGVVECAFPSRRGAREVWSNPPPGCGALWRMAQLGKCARATPRQPAGRVVPGSADLGSESDLTERRIPAAGPHGTERHARTIYAPTDSYGLMEAISSPTCTFPDSSSSTFSSSLELVTMSMT